MSVLTLLDQMSLHYRLVDNEAWARCPYHKDGHPSWSINVKSGVFYCFACGAKGTLAVLIRDLLGYPYPEAVIVANETVGHAIMDKWQEKLDNVSFSPMALKVTEVDMALFTDPPQEALDSKNINLEAARFYGIKWNPDRQTWVFPYRDPYSRELWGWQEKNARIFRNFPAGTKKSRTLFGFSELNPGGKVVLLESPVDCAVLKTNGVDDAVSTFGIPNGLYQLTLLQYKRIHTLVLALDNDKAGIDGTRNLLPEAVKMFSRVVVLDYNGFDVKDVGEMTKEQIAEFDNRLTPAMLWMQNDLQR